MNVLLELADVEPNSCEWQADAQLAFVLASGWSLTRFAVPSALQHA